MKICAIICEFNPFHNGHAYLIEQVKSTGKFDAVVCVMSGSFTQRGDIAVCDKFSRAVHAVKGGADCVIELPAPFAVAPAPVFAEGAVKLLASIPAVCALAFGCEKEIDFYRTARIASDENGAFREMLNFYLDRGESYAKSYSSALAELCGGEVSCSPNNILAIEYAKALLKYRPDMQLLPVERVGGGYNDCRLYEKYSSASAIRAHLGEKDAQNCLPDYSANDLPEDGQILNRWNDIMSYALARAGADGLKKIFGCAEGLENKLKSLCTLPAEEVIKEATSRRYPSSRIKRILAANALGLYQGDARAMLDGAGYIKPLAIRGSVCDELMKELALSPFPVIIKQRDLEALDALSLKMYNLTSACDDVRAVAARNRAYDFTVKKV